MRLSLRLLGIVWMLGGFGLGLGAAALWHRSDQAWLNYLARAETGGQILYDLLQGRPGDGQLSLRPLDDAAQARIARGAFGQLIPAPGARFVTRLTLRGAEAPISVALVSGNLRYPVARLPSGGAPLRDQLGGVTRLMATYCGAPLLLLRQGDGPWLRVMGGARWSCAAQPRDLRLWAGLLAGLGLIALGSWAAETAAGFGRFADRLRSRRPVGGPERYAIEGPEELADMVDAVNTHLAAARAQLADRAAVLSGVSHDLGTPAARLRLRAALIEDEALRGKLERDIDQMAQIIESVLTYTQSELSAEATRLISLTSLVDSVVADYADMGKPVQLAAAPPAESAAGRSVFSAQRGRGLLLEQSALNAEARPVALRRALTNLIDNALKYGRRATVQIKGDARHVRIAVEDSGQALEAAELEALVQPFRRGANAPEGQGVGLGLTIARTVAQQHGGQLSFEQGAQGVRAVLTLARGV